MNMIGEKKEASPFLRVVGPVSPGDSAEKSESCDIGHDVRIDPVNGVASEVVMEMRTVRKE